MAGSTISGTVTQTVTLGSVTYPSSLTVTSTGDVAVTAFSAIGIFAPAGSGTLINDGRVTGGAGSAGAGGSVSGSYGGNGGIGVDLLSGSTATNNGTLTGGAGGSSATGYSLRGGEGGLGGVGVSLVAGALLTNTALIIGGNGGRSLNGGEVPGSPGGAGVALNGGSLVNSGAITGGTAGIGGYLRVAGNGVTLRAGTVTNTGTIIGGAAYHFDGTGGLGVYLSASASLSNNGTIIGAYGYQRGGAGIYVERGGTLMISGVVIGGSGKYGGGYGVDAGRGGSLHNIGTVTGGSGQGGGGGAIGISSGGTLTNAGTITGGSGIYSTRNGAGGGIGVVAVGSVLINDDVIAGGLAGVGRAEGGTGGDGIYQTNGGTITNSAGAIMLGGAGSTLGATAQFGGGNGGAGASLRDGTLTNAGTIAGGNGGNSGPGYAGGSGGTGITMISGAYASNTGIVSGGYAGLGDEFAGRGGAGVWIGSYSVYSNIPDSTLTNSGLITGGNGGNVPAGGTASNIANGSVSGGDGVYVGTGDTLINSGTVVAGVGVYVGAGAAFTSYGTIAGGDGIFVAAGGTLFNSGTVISGVGAYLAAGGTLIDAGTVSGGVYAGVTADAVLFAAGGTLVLDPGAYFVGQVVGNAASADNLELSYLSSNPATAGTLGGLGTQIVNFAQITVEQSSHWTLTGANTIAAGTGLTVQSGATLTATGTLENDGSIVLDPSTMTVAALTGTGSVAIGAGSSFTVQGTISGGETLTFGGTGAYLHLEAPDSVAGSVTNFVTGETIDLTGIDPSTVNYAAGQLTFAGGGDIPLALGNGGTVFASASADGAEVTVLCFCANTLILTPAGECPVQDLAVGDLVTTHRGEARPIVWLGVGKVLATRGQRGAATPVIVRKGALTENVPHRDLRVTKGHALWFDGALIPVEFLVNHRSIAWDDRAQEVALYHIELAGHDVLVANGAPAESYRDDGNRWLFRNTNAGSDLPPQPPCAPVLTGGSFVDAVWRRLLGRAGPRPGFALTDDPDLHLVVDGARVDAARVDGARVDGAPVDAADRRGTACVFALPNRPGSVRIVSRAAAPAELGLARDPRVLGVAVRRVALRQDTRTRDIEASDATLTEGFHGFEIADGLRWTNGDAALAATLFDGFDGPLELVLHLGGKTRYALFGDAGSLMVAA